MDGLASTGAEVLHAPLFRFTKPADSSALDSVVEQLSRYDWIVFSSARAVEVLAGRIRPAEGTRVAAIGTSTAARLHSFGWPVDVIPRSSCAESLIEALIEAGVGPGTVVLFPAGSLARQTLPAGLRDRGARVDEVITYVTEPVDRAPQTLLEELTKGRLDAVTFTSPACVAALADSAGQPLTQLLGSAAAVAIGPTTAAALREKGVAAAATADPSTLASLVEAIVSLFGPAAGNPGAAGIDARASVELMRRARRTIPGGVNSPVRAFGSVGGDARFIKRADGSRIWDVDDHEYLDFVSSWGVMVLGHNHPDVRSAVAAALENGTSFGAPTEAEVSLAELIVELVPSIESVRLVNSGTEATMSAVRLARAATAASKVIKFRGGYHGHGDLFLVEAGSGAATLGIPSSPGVTEGTTADTLVADYNDLESVAALFARNPNDVACVIVEPVAGNMGCVLPDQGFLAGLRSLCTRHGALLVFDEVITGFRLAPGGAQERFGVIPDLTTLGKIIGGGIPVGAYGGRADLMALIAPDGPVYQAGTLSGNPLATAAGTAVLQLLRANPDIYDQLEGLGRRLEDGLTEVIGVGGYPATFNRIGSMGSIFLCEGPVRSWADADRVDRDRFRRFFHALLREGVYTAPSPFETLFISAAHDEADIDKAVRAIGTALEGVYGS